MTGRPVYPLLDLIIGSGYITEIHGEIDGDVVVVVVVFVVGWRVTHGGWCRS